MLRPRPERLASFALTLVAGTSVGIAETVIYVDDTAPGPTHDGLSWCSAYLYLQDALAVAGLDTEIRVAQGTYVPDQDTASPEGTGDREATFQLLQELALRGGYAGCGTPDPDKRDVTAHETILSGDLNGDDGPGLFQRNEENSYHVVLTHTGEPIVLDGFTITGGNANTHAVLFGEDGGGILNLGGSPTITACTLTGNFATLTGGGMSDIFSDGPTLTNCMFTNNKVAAPMASGYGGGGLFSIGFGNPTLTYCTFTENWSDGFGGAIASLHGHPTLLDCAFYGNHANRGGGVHHIAGPAIRRLDAITLINCTLSGNTAGDFGGGIYSDYVELTAANCLLSGNTANEYGGGIMVTSTIASLVNCTLAANSAVLGGSGLASDSLYTDAVPSAVSTTNSIFWNSDDEIWNNDGSAFTITYSDVHGGWPGEGNIVANPLFADPDGPDGDPDTWEDNDYHLSTELPCAYHPLPGLPWVGSPGIDTGDNSAVEQETDLDNHTRIMDGDDDGVIVVDMGAYEFPAIGHQNRYVSFCPWGEAGVAFQVEMTASTYFPASTGVVGWVGEPFDATCEDDLGNPLPGNPPCSDYFVSRVVDEAFFTDAWPAVVHVGDCEIVPVAVYEMRATADGSLFSDPIVLKTIAKPDKWWADIVGIKTDLEWTVPNGIVNFDDIQAAVQKFETLEGPPPLTWVDIHDQVPNAVINMTDVQMIILAFEGAPYPFSDPANCP